MPTDSLLGHIFYENLAAAIDWLTATFGFVEQYRYGDPTSGAQLLLGKACVMLISARPNSSSPQKLGRRTQSLTVFVEDVHAHYTRTQSAGGQIVEELNETCYGERQYGVKDLEGHFWLFSQHVRDVSPDEWGAIMPGRANE